MHVAPTIAENSPHPSPLPEGEGDQQPTPKPSKRLFDGRFPSKKGMFTPMCWIRSEMCFPYGITKDLGRFELSFYLFEGMGVFSQAPMSVGLTKYKRAEEGVVRLC